MPTFKVEQYEVWIQAYEVEAASKAEAIAKVLDGQGEPIEGELELSGIDTDSSTTTWSLGVGLDEMATALKQFGLRKFLDDGRVLSIRSVEES